MIFRLAPQNTDPYSLKLVVLQLFPCLLGQKILECSSSALTATGLEVGLTPAKIIRGVSVSIPTDGVPILVVPLQFEEIGTIYVKLSVKEAQAKIAA